MTTSPRYEGKPLFRLLEAFVLKCVDQLPNEQLAILVAMQPKLTEIYGVQGSWDQIIAAIMEFPDNMHTLILQTWNQNQEIARANGMTLSGQQFAEMFVDQNFG